MRFAFIGALVALLLVGLVATQADARVPRPNNLSCTSC